VFLDVMIGHEVEKYFLDLLEEYGCFLEFLDGKVLSDGEFSHEDMLKLEAYY